MIIVPSRRLLLAAGLAVPLVACASAAAQSSGGSPLTLQVRPRRVFKIADLPRESTEAWFVFVVAEASADIHPTLARVTLNHFAGETEVARAEYWGQALGGMIVQGLPAPTGTFWPLGVRVVARQPASAQVDRMRVTLAFEDAAPASLDIAINTYTQRTDLIFPFRGNGVVTQAGAATGGHRNGSGQFAIDAMGVSDRYALQTGAEFAQNTDLVGFGRELIAPGAGIVVHARGDRPDQPVPGESNPDFHLPEFRGAGDPGNHVVIDHGGGEFSKIGHLMAGSLAVREGQRVEQGQRIGALGNSGDSFAPHVHHQLQDGPLWQSASGLPHRYRNLSNQRLDRGEFFAAS